MAECLFGAGQTSAYLLYPHQRHPWISVRAEHYWYGQARTYNRHRILHHIPTNLSLWTPLAYPFSTFQQHHTRICSSETTYDSFTHSTSLAPPPDLVYMTARTVQHEAHDEGTRDNLNDIVRTYISQRGPLILLYRSPS